MAGPYGGLDRLGVGLLEDRKLRPLAVADLPAQRLRLAIGHPEAGPISVRIGGEPQPEGIDAAVGEAVSAKRSHAWDDGPPRLDTGAQAGREPVADRRLASMCGEGGGWQGVAAGV